MVDQKVNQGEMILILLIIFCKTSQVRAITDLPLKWWMFAYSGDAYWFKAIAPDNKIRVPDHLEWGFSAAPYTDESSFKQTKGRV